MQRRELLQWALGAAATSGIAGRLYAAPGSSRFLLVFLRGGYDAANVLIPYSSPFYYEAASDHRHPGLDESDRTARWRSMAIGR